MFNLILVATGGALGAILRYLLTLICKTLFASSIYGTISVNINPGQNNAVRDRAGNKLAVDNVYQASNIAIDPNDPVDAKNYPIETVPQSMLDSLKLGV